LGKRAARAQFALSHLAALALFAALVFRSNPSRAALLAAAVLLPLLAIWALRQNLSLARRDDPASQNRLLAAAGQYLLAHALALSAVFLL
ncbi:MAG: hypothetical protein LBR12_05030, partial [Opitutaceae bacterium]|nr:hypothetical protein [Opitutaceae bacterium]